MSKVQSKNAILFDVVNDAGPLRDALVDMIGEVTTTDAGLMAGTDKTKLDGIASGATVNATDAALRDRSTHTGEQAISTITGLTSALAGKATPADVAAALAGLVDSSPAALDTLNEFAAALGDDPAFATTISTALGNRLRFDAEQMLTAPQKTQAQANLGLGSAALAASGDFATAAQGVLAATALQAAAIGVSIQAYDAGLSSIAALTTAANKMIYTTAADTYAVTDLTAAGRALLDDADAAAQRTTLQLVKGRDVGNVLTYEDLGGGYQGLGVKADGRVWFKRDVDKKSEFATVWITKNINSDAAGTDTTGSVAALRIDETINRGDLTSYHWPLTVQLTHDPLVGSGGAGQHVAAYIRSHKKGAGNIWGACVEIQDDTTNPTGASVGQEITCKATGADDNDQRIGLHVSMFSASGADGTNMWSNGLVIGGPIAKVQAKRLIRLQGASAIGIDMTEMETGYADVAMKFRENHKLEWHAGFSSTSASGSISWNNTINTFQFSGMKYPASVSGGVSGAVPAYPVGYIQVQINGEERTIPFYGT